MALPMRLALVTGDSAGLGCSTAVALLEKGWSVIGVARRSAPIDHRAFRHEALDLGDLAAVEAFASRLSAEPLQIGGGEPGEWPHGPELRGVVDQAEAPGAGDDLPPFSELRFEP